MSFASTQNSFSQTHFEILEIDLPVILGETTLTVNGVVGPGFGTPLSADEEWTGEFRTYRFTNINAPLINGGPVFRCIKSINEVTPQLKVGKGLASKGSLSVTLDDFVGDPNHDASGVAGTNVPNQGTFFGKLNARQVVVNKNARLKCYRHIPGQQMNEYLQNDDAEIRYYKIESLRSNNNGTWTLQCKDELFATNSDEKTWPPQYGSYVRQDFNETVTTIPVDDVTDWQSFIDASASGVFYIRIGDEFMRATAVSNNMTLSATLTVSPRGGLLYADDSGYLLTKTDASSHSGGDEIFICHVSDDERIDTLLAKMLVDSDIDPALIPTADWATEVDTWQSRVRINTLWHEPEDLNKQIEKILGAYMLDMWFDPVARLIKLSAVSVWRETSSTLTEGKEIRYGTVRVQPLDDLRTSRALVLYEKPYLTDSDDFTSYTKAARYSDDTVITNDLYGEHKDLILEPSAILVKRTAELLTQRTVSRFKHQPNEYSWITDEQYRTFETGDVVNIITEQMQGFDGTAESANVRAQITSITPQYKGADREYRVTAMTYEADVDPEAEVPVYTGNVSFINLYTEFGEPPSAVDVQVVFHNAIVRTLEVGSFPPGSTVKIILSNSVVTAKSGDGGHGGNINEDITGGHVVIQKIPGSNGGWGGTALDCMGTTTDIYLSGPTGNEDYPVANGYILAPNGGNGGDASQSVYQKFIFSSDPKPWMIAGDGGNGGDGIITGAGGGKGVTRNPSNGGEPLPNGYTADGNPGASGSVLTAGIDSALFGQPGVNGLASPQEDPENPGTYVQGGLGGQAGFGIVNRVTGGGIVVDFSDIGVTLHFDPADTLADKQARYVKGNGTVKAGIW